VSLDNHPQSQKLPPSVRLTKANLQLIPLYIDYVQLQNCRRRRPSEATRTKRSITQEGIVRFRETTGLAHKKPYQKAFVIEVSQLAKDSPSTATRFVALALARLDY
jgi:hypothetical protein